MLIALTLDTNSRALLFETQLKMERIADLNKEVDIELLRSFAKLEKHLISLELALQQCQEQIKNDKVSKFINDVNARTKKPKAVPISVRKPKRHANQSVATPPKKIVALDPLSEIKSISTEFSLIGLELGCLFVGSSSSDSDHWLIILAAEGHVFTIKSLKKLFTEMSDEENPPNSPPQGVDSYYRIGNFEDPSLIIYLATANGAVSNFNIQPNLIAILPLFRDQAKAWFTSLEPGSINSWSEMKSAFLDEFYSISKTTAIRNKIKSFCQIPGEQFHEAFSRLKELLRSCPHHDVPK
ncbi:hypothetical protein Tco_0667424 [Tanacetum coccineum]